MRAIGKDGNAGYFFGDKSIEASINVQITSILQEMDGLETKTEEYERCLGNLERLTEIRKKQNSDAVNRDTLAIIAGNLLGILLIIVYEQKHVMTSKGFNQLIKPR